MKPNKQTAVDWLVEQLQAPCRGIPSHILEQAKRIEKEQINRAFYDGCTYLRDEALINAITDYNKRLSLSDK